ncbi:MAG TPA: transcription antitermination factor NusB [Phycisphaerales bacterium]|nr:transcription antitermination factor NusB [Phycisphaerales bacterium]
MGKSLTDVIKDVREGVSDEEETLYYLTETERAAALDFFESLLRGAWDNREVIDEQLRERLENWSLDRVGHLERAILRLGCYEILHRDDIPRKVSINEMVELSKSFCDMKSKDFINGVLDSITP